MDKMSLVDYAKRNDVFNLQKLLENGVNINQFEYGRSALHAACGSDAIVAGELLISNGIDLNLQDEYTGATALHYCAVYNYFEIGKMIIENKGRLDIADNFGNQPLWTAIFNVKGKIERVPLVELFLKHGADKYHKNKVGKSPFDLTLTGQIKLVPLLELLGSG
jgi:ankyrin repeat protein